ALDFRRGVVIDQRDTVPEDISLRCLNQIGLLPDAERRFRGDGGDAGLNLGKAVRVVVPDLLEGDPLLAARRQVLPVIVAVRAIVGRRGLPRVLSPAGQAEERGFQRRLRRRVSVHTVSNGPGMDRTSWFRAPRPTSALATAVCRNYGAVLPR